MPDVQTVVDLGRKVKAKYPVYADKYSDAELGRRVRQKYPQYSRYVDIGTAEAPLETAPAGQPPTPQVEQPGILQRLVGAMAPVAEAAGGIAAELGKPGSPPMPWAPAGLPPHREAFAAGEKAAVANPAFLVGREPTIIPELMGPPAPLPMERPQMMPMGEGPPIPVLQTREQMQRQGAEAERTIRTVAREVLSMINPVNAALVAASGGASVAVRGLANTPQMVALLSNSPRALRFLDIVGEGLVPATFTGIAGSQAKDQLSAARKAYERGDPHAGQEHTIGAFTSLMIGVAGAAATGVRVKGAVASQPPVKAAPKSRRPSLRAQQARESATQAKTKAAALEETGRGAAAELQTQKAKVATAEAQEIGTQEWAKVFGEATPKTLDGKPVQAKLSGVSEKGRPVYEVRDESGKVVYSGSATEVSTRLRYEGPKAAERTSAGELSTAARSLRGKRQQELALEAEIPKGYTRDKQGFLRDESGKVVLPGEAQVRFGAQGKWKPGDPIPKTGVEATGTEVLPTRPEIKAPAPAKTPAAKEAASIVEGLRKETAKAPAPKPLAPPKPAPVAKAPTARVAVAPVVPPGEKEEPITPATAPKFKINRNAIKGPMELEVEQDIADRLFGGQTRVNIEIDEDGAIQATPIGGGDEKWIAFAGDKVIPGYRIPPKEAAQKPAKEKKAAKVQAEPERPVSPAPAPVAAAERPNWIPKESEPGDRGWKIKVSDIDVEPERFQFRARAGGRSGVVDNRLAKVKKWDTQKEKTMLVWMDPEDNRVKLIDGHHRLDKAKKLGVEEIQPHFIPWDKAPTERQARLAGVISNLREGNVDAIDVARYMRESGIANLDGLHEDGIPASGKQFRDGQSLSRLDESLFQDVVRGRERESYGIAAGQASGEKSDQIKILEVIDAREDRTGRIVDRGMAESIASRVAGADTRTETTKTLFGDMETQESLFEQEADITDFIRRRLGQEKRLFGTISSAGAAEELEAAGNIVQREGNLERAQEFSQVREIFDRLADRSGPVDSIVKQQAKRLAEGENASTVRREAYEEIVAELRENIPGREKERSSIARQTPGAEHIPASQPEVGSSVLFAGLPTSSEPYRIAAKRAVKDLKLLQEGALTAKEAGQDWWREWRKEPHSLFYLTHLPNYVADVVPEFTPIFKRARASYQEGLSHVADLMDDSNAYWKLSKGQARLLDERLIDADRRGVTAIDETQLEDETLRAFRGYRRSMDRAFRLMEDTTVDLATMGRVTSAGSIQSKTQLLQALKDVGLNDAQASKRADLVWETLEKFRESRRTGFVPHTRFGDWLYGIAPSDPAKPPIIFEGKTYVAQARGRLRKLQSEHADELASGEYKVIEPYKKKEENVGDIISEFFGSRLFEELSPELADAVKKEIEPFLKKFGVKAHFLRREGVPGYERDVHRATADYYLMVSHFVARTRMFRDMRDMLAAVPSRKARTKKYAENYVRFLAEPSNDLAWLRSLMFHWFLGLLNPAAPTLNLTQVQMITAPWLLRYAGMVDVEREVLGAYKDVGKIVITRGKIDYDRLPDDVRKDAIKSLHDGTLAAQLSRELGAVKKRGQGSNIVDWGQEASSFLFRGSEHLNRIVSFVAAHRLGQASLPSEFKNVQEFAEDVVNKTQFEYAKYNRPQFMWPSRWRIEPVLFMFKTFPVAHFEVLLRLARGAAGGPPIKRRRDLKALGSLLGILTLAAGPFSLPFAKDFFESLAALWKLNTGVQYDPEILAKQIAEDMTNEQVGEFVAGGAARFMPIDMAPSLSQGEIIGIGRALRTGKPQDAFAVFGMAGRFSTAMEMSSRGDPRWIEFLAPRTIAGFLRAYRQMQDQGRGGAQSRVGYEFPLPGEPKHLTGLEVLGTALSFRPTRVSQAYETAREMRLAGTSAAGKKARVIREVVRALEGTKDELKAAIEAVQKFNKNFPDQQITPEQINNRADEESKDPTRRILEGMPRTARPTGLEILKKRGILPQ